MINKKIGIIGCGNMGGTIVNGIARSKLFSQVDIYVSDADRKKAAVLARKTGVNGSTNQMLSKTADIVLLAVKPKDFDSVVQEIADFVTGRKLLISVAAGISTKHIEDLLGTRQPVVRVMPNLAVTVGEGMSALCAGTFSTKQHLNTVKTIFASLGKTIIVPETMMNAVTAVSGSGPAYIFKIMQDLIAAAKKAGLPADVSIKLVKQTVLGAAILANESNVDPNILKERVTSPGGTTEAALRYLEKNNFERILIEAVQKAKERAQELGK